MDSDRLVRGGQGRSDDEVEESAWLCGVSALLCLLLAAAFLALLCAGCATDLTGVGR